MFAYDCFEIEIGENVAVEDDSRLANQIFGKLVSAGRSHRLGLDGVFELHTEIRAVAEQLLDLVGLIRERECDIRDAGAAQRVDLIKQKRSITNRNDWLRRVNG